MGLDLTDEFDYHGDGVIGTATKESTTNIDFKVEDNNCIVDGGEIIFKDATWGDYIKVEVVDKDGISYPAGTVLKTYIPKRYLHPDIGKSDLNVPYAGHVPNGMYIRVKYTSVGTVNDVKVAINFWLHIRH